MADALGDRERGRTAARSGKKLQLALDVTTLPEALAVTQAVAGHIDVIECGTILCIARGLDAVRAVRAAHPDHLLLADVRIVEAGSVIAKMVFDTGADLVSVVSGASLTTVSAVVGVARGCGGDVQVELLEGWTTHYVKECRDMGIRHFIVKRSRDAEAAGAAWGADALGTVRDLHALGARVTVTGGLSARQIRAFGDGPAEIFIAGRAIYGADDPEAAAAELRAAVDA